MNRIWLLDSSYNKIRLIENYYSFIWTERFQDLGDCEIAMAYSKELMQDIQNARYIVRDGITSMYCLIEKYEIQSVADEGDRLILTGVDMLAALRQRIIAKNSASAENVAVYVARLITENIISPTDNNRKISNIFVGVDPAILDTITEDVECVNLWEHVKEIAIKTKYGFTASGPTPSSCYIGLAKPSETDIVLTTENGTLASANYTNDKSQYGNTSYVKIENGDDSTINEVADQTYTGLDRYEFIGGGSSNSASTDITEESFKAIDANGYWNTTDPDYYNESLYISPTYGVVGYRSNTNVHAADSTDLSTKIWSYSMNATYQAMLAGNAGEAGIVDKAKIESVDATASVFSTWKYRQNYDVGSIVRIRVADSIDTEAIISEVVECVDENGYTIQPKLEILETVNRVNALLTEDNVELTTESDEIIELEEE